MSKTVSDQVPRRRRLPRSLPICWATKKVRYPDSEAALEVLHSSAAARGMWGEDHRRQERRWYECLSCHGVHITSQTVEAWIQHVGEAG
jgi:hypothetical protein